MHNGFNRAKTNTPKVNISMAVESDPVLSVAGLPQLHPRQRNKTKYHIKSGPQKQCVAHCRTEQKKCVFSWRVEAYGHVINVY
jgi:hypothetical protein